MSDEERQEEVQDQVEDTPELGGEEDQSWSEIEKEIENLIAQLDREEEGSSPQSEVEEESAFQPPPKPQPQSPVKAEERLVTREAVRDEVPQVPDVDMLASAVEARRQYRERVVSEIIKKVEAGVPLEYRTPLLRESIRNHVAQVGTDVLEMSLKDENALGVIRKVATGEVALSRKERIPPPPSGEPVGGTVAFGEADIQGELPDAIAYAQRVFGLTPEEIDKALRGQGGEL